MICGAPPAPESPKPEPPRPPPPRRPAAPEPGPLADLLGLERPAAPQGVLDFVAEFPEPPLGDAGGAEGPGGGADAALGSGDCGGSGGSGASTPPTSASCDWEADFGSDSCASAWACPAAGQLRPAGCEHDLDGLDLLGSADAAAPPALLGPAALEAMDSKQLMALQQMIAQTLVQRAGAGAES